MIRYLYSTVIKRKRNQRLRADYCAIIDKGFDYTLVLCCTRAAISNYCTYPLKISASVSPPVCLCVSLCITT